MSTIIMNCFCDSIVAKLCEKSCECNQNVIELGTNCADIAITKCVCMSIVFVVLITVAGFLAWKLIDHHAKKNVDKRNRKWEIEDNNRKQKSDLLNKRIDFLKDLCYEIKENESKKVIKAQNRSEIEQYLAELKTAMDSITKEMNE